MHHVDPEVGCLHELVRIRVTDATGQGLGWGLEEGRTGGGVHLVLCFFDEGQIVGLGYDGPTCRGQIVA